MARFQADHVAARREYDEVRQVVAERLAAEAETAKRLLQEAQWESATIFEATRKGLDAQLRESQAQLAGQGQLLQRLQQEAVEILRRRRQWRVLCRSRNVGERGPGRRGPPPGRVDRPGPPPAPRTGAAGHGEAL